MNMYWSVTDSETQLRRNDIVRKKSVTAHCVNAMMVKDTDEDLSQLLD